MSSVGNFDFRARRRGHKGQSRPMGGYDYEPSSFPTSPAAYDQFSWPPPGLSPYSSSYDYDHDRYERERYEHDLYERERYEHERYERERYERERYEQERYERDRYEHDRYYDYDRYEQDRYEHSRSGNGRYGHERYGHERWDDRYGRERYNQKLPDYIDPRIPSTHPDPEYLAYLDSLYTPLEGMPQAPIMPDFDDWRADDWSANPHIFEKLDDANDEWNRADVVAKEDHSRAKYFGDAPGSSCSTSDTDGQVLKVPTKGSAKHHLGSCKPCAFVYKTGCNSGYDCEFCHLCKPGEKKRRKKERKQQMRHLR